MLGPRSAPVLTDLVTGWRPDVLTPAVLAVAVVGYLRARQVLRSAGRPWSAGRDALFGLGVALAVGVSSGFPEARAHQLMWVFTAQQLALLLAVPVVIMAATSTEVRSTDRVNVEPRVAALTSEAAACPCGREER